MSMKIVFHRYNSICEPDYLEAFRALGLEVVENTEEIGHPNLPMKRRIETVSRMILEERPLFVFSINFFPFISMICEKLGVLYVAESVDCPVPEIYNTQIRNAHNRVFLFDSAQYESIASENPAGIFHLPLGAAAGRITAHLNATGHGEDGAFGPEDERYDSDVSFVGSLYEEKDNYLDVRQKLSPEQQGFLDGLVRAQLQLPGLALVREVLKDEALLEKYDLGASIRAADPGFYHSEICVRNMDSFLISDWYLGFHLTHLDRVRTLNLLAQVADVDFYTRSDTGELSGVHCHGGVTSLDQMPIVFRRSRINLNLTMRPIETGLPQRIWDVLGAGGFLLTDERAELPSFLVPGEHVETFADEAELVEKIRYYLEHPAEREAIARAGYEEICRAGTVLHRVMEMVKIVAAEV